MQIDWNPTDKKLREFALVCVGGFALAGTIALLRFHSGLMAGVFYLGAALTPALGWCRPGLIRPLYLGLSLLAFPIGFAVSNAVLAALFVGVFTPLSLCFRLRRRDVLGRKRPFGARSYWKDYPAGERDAAGYLRQF